MRMTILCVATIYTIFSSGYAFSQDKLITVETIEGIKLATVPVVCGVFENGKFILKKIMGSAFFINEEGYFMTAEHVLKDWEKIDNCKGDFAPVIYLPYSDWQNVDSVKWFIFTTCIKNAETDIAVCKTKINPFTDSSLKRKIKSVTFGDTASIYDGVPIAFTGFPLDYMRPITSQGYIASDIKAMNLFIIDKAAWPGASGSPVYLSDGRVVGVMRQAGVNYGSGLAFARSSKPIIDFLTKNKISFHQGK